MICVRAEYWLPRPIACLRESWQPSLLCCVLGCSLYAASAGRTELLGTTLFFYAVLKKLKLVVCLILQADEAFHYLTSNTLQEMESSENRSH